MHDPNRPHRPSLTDLICAENDEQYRELQRQRDRADAYDLERANERWDAWIVEKFGSQDAYIRAVMDRACFGLRGNVKRATELVLGEKLTVQDVFGK